jgi:hypothetical protein
MAFLMSTLALLGSLDGTFVSFHGSMLKPSSRSGLYPGAISRCPLPGRLTFLVHFKAPVGFGINEAVRSSCLMNAPGACSPKFIFRISLPLSWPYECCRMRVPQSGGPLSGGLVPGGRDLGPLFGITGSRPVDDHLEALVGVDSLAFL